MVEMIQPNAWSCYPTALSVCTGIPFDSIIRAIGHDGSRMLYPDLGDPWGREGFIWEEIALAALHHGWALTRMYADAENEDGSRRPAFADPGALLSGVRCDSIIEANRGTVESPRWHAMVYRGLRGEVYDPLTGQSWGDDGYPGWPITFVAIPSRMERNGYVPYVHRRPRLALAEIVA